MQNQQESRVSRRTVLQSVPVLAAGGLAGCTDGLGGDTPSPTPTPSPSPTPSPTPTPAPDRPSIERQTVLRDKAAVTHIRREVTGEISWPEFETFNIIDGDLLGRWETEGQTLEFNSDLTFSDIRSGEERRGEYYTVPPLQYIELTYANGDTYELNYQVSQTSSGVGLEIFSSDGEPIDTYRRTVDGQDRRSAVQVFKGLVFYEPEGASTTSEQLETGASGSGFIVTPDGYIVTNAHVIGSHRDPRESLYFRLAVKQRSAFTDLLAEYDLSEDQREQILDILLDETFDYYAEKSQVTAVSTDVGILYGTADPGVSYEAKSWSATIETTGSVTEEVGGEPTWGRDVAVLKVDEQEPLPTVTLGDSTSLGSGAKVFSIGYPDIGLQELFEDRNTTLEPSLTSGVVSARRTLNSGVETIQTDMDLNPGNSGGPVYNGDGEVVGIATFRPTDLDLAEVSFALPIETAEGFLGELGVENETSELTATYEEGLNALWRDDCETLAERMETVTDLWPEHPYADEIAEGC